MLDTLPLLAATPFPPLRRGTPATLQVNLGYRCNQRCLHCHVNAGPTRTEQMDDTTVAAIPAVLAARLADLLTENFADASIRVAGHCYGCTAGQGSSCGGALGADAAHAGGAA